MPERQVSFEKRFAADPVLAEFAKPFPDLLGRSRSIEGGFKRMAAKIGKTGRAAVVQLTVSGGRPRGWYLSLSPETCKLSKGQNDRPDLEILAPQKTWLEIVKGTVSLLEAFGQGKMRVRGDITLARRIARNLQSRQKTSPGGR